MRAIAIVLLLVALGCNNTPVAPTVTEIEIVEVPFEPNTFSGTWSGTMTTTNGVSISGAFLTVELQEGTTGRGEWTAIGLIGVPGSKALFLIYRGTADFSIQNDNSTLIGRWAVEVIDPDTDAILCTDSAPLRGTLRTLVTMRWASDAFTACSALPGVAPHGVVADWTKETV